MPFWKIEQIYKAKLIESASKKIEKLERDVLRLDKVATLRLREYRKNMEFKNKLIDKLTKKIEDLESKLKD